MIDPQASSESSNAVPLLRRLLRFRLRTMLVVITLVALAIAGARPYLSRRATVHWLSLRDDVRMRDSEFVWTTRPPPPPHWPWISDDSAWSDVRALRFDSPAVLTDRDVARLVEFPGLEILDLGGSRISDRSLSSLARLRSLKELRIDRTRITDAGLRHLRRTDSLEFLSLADTRVSDDGVRYLQSLPSLRYLNVRHTQVTHRGVAVLRRRLPELEVFGVAEPPQEDDSPVVAQLKWLNARWREDAEGNILSIDLSSARFRQDFAPLFRLLEDEDRLRTLDLTGLPITGDHLEALRGVSQVNVLLLNMTRVLDKDLACLAGWRDLRGLFLADTPINGSGLRYLSDLDMLERLDLRTGRMTDEGLAQLPLLPALRRLYLSGQGLTNASLAHVARQTDLELLVIYDAPRISDRGLAQLQTLRWLREVRLIGTGVTAEGAVSLEQGMPSCRVTARQDPGLERAAE